MMLLSQWAAVVVALQATDARGAARGAQSVAREADALREEAAAHEARLCTPTDGEEAGRQGAHHVERGVPERVAGVGLGAGGQEHGHDACVAVLRGHVKGRVAVLRHAGRNEG